MSTWCRESYEASLTRHCFSGTPFCGSVGWEARWGEDGPALKDDPQMRQLVEMEVAVSPVSLWAQRICRQIDTLPDCGFAFPQHVESVCTNIGRQDAEAAKALKCYTVGPDRLRLLGSVALILDGWLKGAIPDLVAAAVAAQDPGELDWVDIAAGVYGALGDREPRKELLVRRLLERLRFWLRAPYGWAKGDDSARLGYLYLPDMGVYGGWDYFGFEVNDPQIEELTQRIRDELETPERWLDVITSTWPCAPKVMRYMEKIIGAIGRLGENGSSSFDELVQSAPAEGEVLPVLQTYLSSETSRRLYDTSIRALGVYAGDAFCPPATLPDGIDEP